MKYLKLHQNKKRYARSTTTSTEAKMVTQKRTL